MVQILVIEDEFAVRENIVDLLEAEDYNVITTENGFMGIIWATEHLPDLIISDVMMPEIDGHDILRALRQNPVTSAIPFIFLTALSDKGDIRHGMNLGADDYLTKPYARIDLLNAISARIEKNKQGDEDGHIASAPAPADIFKQRFEKALPKLQIAVHMLKDLEPGGRRNQCVELLRQTCIEEIDLLDQIPNLEDFMSVEDAELLRQLQ